MPALLHRLLADSELVCAARETTGDRNNGTCGGESAATRPPVSPRTRLGDTRPAVEVPAAGRIPGLRTDLTLDRAGVERRTARVEWRTAGVEWRAAAVGWRTGGVGCRTAGVGWRTGGVEWRTAGVEWSTVGGDS